MSSKFNKKFYQKAYPDHKQVPYQSKGYKYKRLPCCKKFYQLYPSLNIDDFVSDEVCVERKMAIYHHMVLRKDRSFTYPSKTAFCEFYGNYKVFDHIIYPSEPNHGCILTKFFLKDDSTSENLFVLEIKDEEYYLRKCAVIIAKLHDLKPCDEVQYDLTDDRSMNVIAYTVNATKEHQHIEHISLFSKKTFETVKRELTDKSTFAFSRRDFKEILVLVNVSMKKKYLERYNRTINTTVKELRKYGIPYLLLVADEAVTESRIVNDFLYVPCEDTYQKLNRKIFMAMKFLSSHMNVDYVLKIDDDCSFDLLKFDDTVLKHPYMGNVSHNTNPKWRYEYLGYYKGNTKSKWASGGRGYFLSKDAVHKFVQNPVNFSVEIYEDKMIANQLLLHDIHPVQFQNISSFITSGIEFPLSIPYLPLSSVKLNKKVAVMIFHKNILKICEKQWVMKSVKSIYDQTYQDFDVFEINYGGREESVINDKSEHHTHHFYSIDFKNHSYAMNFLLDEIFTHEESYDLVFNVNLDDYYHPSRFDEQIKIMKMGYSISSSLWTYVDGSDCKKLKFTLDTLQLQPNLDSTLATEESVREQILKKQNVVNHPGVCFSRQFWKENLKYRDELPHEDLALWYHVVKESRLHMAVINQNLVYYRIHNNQIGSVMKTEKDFNETYERRTDEIADPIEYTIYQTRLNDTD